MGASSRGEEVTRGYSLVPASLLHTHARLLISSKQMLLMRCVTGEKSTHRRQLTCDLCTQLGPRSAAHHLLDLPALHCTQHQHTRLALQIHTDTQVKQQLDVGYNGGIFWTTERFILLLFFL